MTAGERIKKVRKDAGLTQAQLAEKLNIPYQSIGQWERNIRKPKTATLAKIATALAGNLCYTTAKGVYMDSPKNGRNRVVFIGDDTIALLRQLRTEQAKKAVSAFVFTKEGSPEPMHPQSPTRYLKKLSERCGLPDLHPHKLRHTFASVAITNGADVASVSEALGHSDKAVTL